MNLPVRARLGHEIPSWVKEGSFYFVTINCVPRRANQLCQPSVGEAVLAAAAHNHERGVWHCRLMLLMPDHLHALIGFPRERGMKTVIANWKRYLATRESIEWQRDFFDHRLRDHHEEVEKAHYILLNPVRRGLCSRAEDWSWTYRPGYLPPGGVSH
jgi:REP element-mobilizing transposase RayT